MYERPLALAADWLVVRALSQTDGAAEEGTASDDILHPSMRKFNIDRSSFFELPFCELQILFKFGGQEIRASGASPTRVDTHPGQPDMPANAADESTEDDESPLPPPPHARATAMVLDEGEETQSDSEEVETESDAPAPEVPIDPAPSLHLKKSSISPIRFRKHFL
jgi:hypothetical protein